MASIAQAFSTWFQIHWPLRKKKALYKQLMASRFVALWGRELLSMTTIVLKPYLQYFSAFCFCWLPDFEDFISGGSKLAIELYQVYKSLGSSSALLWQTDAKLPNILSSIFKLFFLGNYYYKYYNVAWLDLIICLCSDGFHVLQWQLFGGSSTE